MNCFWERKQLSAPDVHLLLGVESGVTDSTIKSLIDRPEAKGALSRAEAPGRVIYCRAAVSAARKTWRRRIGCIRTSDVMAGFIRA